MLPAFVMSVPWIRPGARILTECTTVSTMVGDQQTGLCVGSRPFVSLGAALSPLEAPQTIGQLLEHLKSERYQIRGGQGLDIHGSFPRSPKILMRSSTKTCQRQ